jgi:hypothetical protein
MWGLSEAAASCVWALAGSPPDAQLLHAGSHVSTAETAHPPHAVRQAAFQLATNRVSKAAHTPAGQTATMRIQQTMTTTYTAGVQTPVFGWYHAATTKPR